MRNRHALNDTNRRGEFTSNARRSLARNLLLERVARNAASWLLAHGAKCVNASFRADRRNSIRFEVGPQILHRGGVGILFSILLGPLHFDSFKKPQIVDAGIGALHFQILGLCLRQRAFAGLRLGRHALMKRLDLLPRLDQIVALLAQLRHFIAQARQFACLPLLDRRAASGSLGGAGQLLLQRRDLGCLLLQRLIFLAHFFERLLLDKIHRQRGDSPGA